MFFTRSIGNKALEMIRDTENNKSVTELDEVILKKLSGYSVTVLNMRVNGLSKKDSDSILAFLDATPPTADVDYHDDDIVQYVRQNVMCRYHFSPNTIRLMLPIWHRYHKLYTKMLKFQRAIQNLPELQTLQMSGIDGRVFNIAAKKFRDYQDFKQRCAEMGTAEPA